MNAKGDVRSRHEEQDRFHQPKRDDGGATKRELHVRTHAIRRSQMKDLLLSFRAVFCFVPFYFIAARLCARGPCSMSILSHSSRRHVSA